MTDQTTDPAEPGNEPAPDNQTDPSVTAEQAAAASADEAPTVAYTPTPEYRPDWATPSWTAAPTEPEPAVVGFGTASATGAPGPAALAEGATAGAIGPDAAGAGSAGAGSAGAGAAGAPRRAGVGSIVVASILSAVLASGGTVLALKGSGALDRVVTASNGNPAVTTGSRQPVTIDESSAVIDAAAKAGPAVVRIFVSGSATDPFGGTIPEQGVGSGVIFDSAGWILTNRHVVTDGNSQIADKLTVELKDGRQFDGTVYGVDTLTDLAIVRIQTDGLTAATMGTSSDLEVGQLAIAIGSPLGTYSNSVTSGIVSATGRSVTVESGDRLNNLIQTDAAINPGNSGGPLLDAVGDVIGINTAIAQGSNGIGFAIPIDIARPIMQQALAGQQLSRPYIGVRYVAIDRQVQDEQHLSVDHGALVSKSQNQNGQTLEAVISDGPAARAGIREGDIITKIGSQVIDAEHPLDLVLASFAPGQTVALELLRGGQTLTVSVTLGTRPNDL